MPKGSQNELQNRTFACQNREKTILGAEKWFSRNTNKTCIESIVSASKRLQKLTFSVHEGTFGASEIHLDFCINFGREKVAQMPSKLEPKSDRKRRAVFFALFFWCFFRRQGKRDFQ